MDIDRGRHWAILLLLIFGSTFPVHGEDSKGPDSKDCCPDKNTWLALTGWFISRECSNDRCCITDKEWQIWGDIIAGIFSAKCRYSEGRNGEDEEKDIDAKSERKGGREGEMKQKRFGGMDFWHGK